MTPITPERLPGFVEYPHRQWFYVEARPGMTVGDLLQGAMQAALTNSPGEEAAIIEERAILRLPAGERLQGVSFKATHPAMRQAVRVYAEGRSLRFGRLVAGTIRFQDGLSIPLAECECFAY
ncbi:MAG: hypothetical protein JWN86_2525 [Planctomycetota bacterium]|nr:hypothetical protein [Planctomycetota bacterium]